MVISVLGVFYGVQNDIRQSVFQTLRFCESEDLFIDGVFQQDTGGFAIVGTVAVQFIANGAEVGRARRFGVIIGVVGIAMIVSNYFIYRKIEEKGKAKYSAKILELSGKMLHVSD